MSPLLAGTALADTSTGTISERREAALGLASSIDEIIRTIPVDYRQILTPYVRYQNYLGGYRSVSNAPFGAHDQWNLGVEWQLRKEMELTAEYSLVDGLNLNAINEPGAVSYRPFRGGVLRFQFQVNY